MENVFKKFDYTDFLFFNMEIISSMLNTKDKLLISDWKNNNNTYDETVIEAYEEVWQNIDSVMAEDKDDIYKYILATFAGCKVLLIDEEFDEKCFIMIYEKDLKNFL